MLELWRGGWRAVAGGEPSGSSRDRGQRSATCNARRHGFGCGANHAPFACAVAVIRWGPNTSSDKLRSCARCTACGNKGATIQHPGWGGNDVGFLPFPVEMVTP